MITKEEVHSLLQTLGPTLLRKPYDKGWTKDNPTYGYCYLVTEAIYHYTEMNYTPFVISTPEWTHWYLKGDDGKIYDFTAEQFESERIPYEKAVGKGFMKGGVQTNKGWISKRGFQMAQHLGLV